MKKKKISSLNQALRIVEDVNTRRGFQGEVSIMNPKLKSFVHRAKNQTVKNSKVLAKKAERYVHKKPWIIVAISSFISVLLGFFLGRKTK